jgi:RNA-directed DNA polymerase
MLGLGIGTPNNHGKRVFKPQTGQDSELKFLLISSPQHCKNSLWIRERLLVEDTRVSRAAVFHIGVNFAIHERLMARVALKVTDKVLLGLMGRYLRAGVMVGSTFEATEWGTPQGSPLSPLLSNILLDDLDKELEARGHRFVRYVDDLVILVKSRRAGRRVMVNISRYLTQKLKLKVNREKSQVVKIEALNYLGFTFRGIRIFATDQALRDFKHRLKGLTSRSCGVSMADRINRLNRYLRGWMNYFGISQHYSPIEELDGWLRRRIRMCYWKQWRRPRTRIGNLLKLGTSKRHAILTGISRKGYWRLSLA